MKWLPEFRALALLRRITRATESIAVSQRALAELAKRAWTEDHPIPHRRRQPTDLGTLDQSAANRAWKLDRAEAMMDDTDDLGDAEG